MKIAPLVLGALTLCGLPVAAQTDAPKTRAQVVAELAEVQRTGDIFVGDGNRKLNEVRPELFPPKAPVPSKTRAQVVAELAEARRTGDMPNEYGLKLNEIDPQRYANADRQSPRASLK